MTLYQQRQLTDRLTVSLTGFWVCETCSVRWPVPSGVQCPRWTAVVQLQERAEEVDLWREVLDDRATCCTSNASVDVRQRRRRHRHRHHHRQQQQQHSADARAIIHASKTSVKLSKHKRNEAGSTFHSRWPATGNDLSPRPWTSVLTPYRGPCPDEPN